MSDIPNTHSFVATFEDGTQIFQTDEDKSEHVEGKNCYFDVLEYQKKSRLLCFVLNGPDHDYAVDLIDGHFEIDAVRFYMHRPDLYPYEGFELVYSRTCQRHFESGSMREIGAEVKAYTLGWKTGDEQRVMVVSA